MKGGLEKHILSYLSIFILIKVRQGQKPTPAVSTWSMPAVAMITMSVAEPETRILEELSVAADD